MVLCGIWLSLYPWNISQFIALGVQGRKVMRLVIRMVITVISILAVEQPAQCVAGQAVGNNSDDANARPPVTKTDVQIVQHARQILDSPSVWNRADTRVCPGDAKTFSLYCALEKATNEVTGKFEHRGAAMQEARFVIDEELAKGNHYDHRLKDYNNDPKTTFADVQKFFDLLQARIQKRLAEGAVPESPK